MFVRLNGPGRYSEILVLKPSLLWRKGNSSWKYRRPRFSRGWFVWYTWKHELIPFALVVRGENLTIRTRCSRFPRIFFGQMGPFGGGDWSLILSHSLSMSWTYKAIRLAPLKWASGAMVGGTLTIRVVLWRYLKFRLEKSFRYAVTS